MALGPTAFCADQVGIVGLVSIPYGIATGNVTHVERRSISAYTMLQRPKIRMTDFRLV